jgi:hypothetical protein
MLIIYVCTLCNIYFYLYCRKNLTTKILYIILDLKSEIKNKRNTQVKEYQSELKGEDRCCGGGGYQIQQRCGGSQSAFVLSWC